MALPADRTPAPPLPPPPLGSGPHYETVIDQMAAWMRDRLAAAAQHED